jgi:hydrogenase maturation protease
MDTAFTAAGAPRYADGHDRASRAASAARSELSVADLTRDYAHPRTIVIGLGNPLLGDDGVGWRVADKVEELLRAALPGVAPARGVEVERLGVGGLALMERLTGYDAAVFVDAAEFRDRPIGEVRARSLAELEEYGPGHLDSAHDASLIAALALGHRLGAHLPARIDVVSIQVRSNDVFGDELSPEVAAAVPAAVAVVMDLLGVDR